MGVDSDTTNKKEVVVDLPGVFTPYKHYDTSADMQPVMVIHNELQWKTPLSAIPKCSKGITCGRGDVNKVEQSQSMEELSQRRITRELPP